jgi:cell division septum initiation protein DivIVA
MFNRCVSAEEREELNKDPRRTQIHLEIRQIEEKMDKLKRQIDDESIVLESLKHTADAHNSLLTLQEQCEKELDVLDDNIREDSYSLTKFDIVVPKHLPRDGDDDGDQLSKAIEALSEAAREKYDVAGARLDRAKDDTMNTQKIVSEKSALSAGSQKTLTSVKSKLLALAGSVADVQKVVEELRQHETRRGATLTATEDTPRELLQYLDKRLEELEEDVPDLNAAKVTKKIMKLVMKRVSMPGRRCIECCVSALMMVNSFLSCRRQSRIRM